LGGDSNLSVADLYCVILTVRDRYHKREESQQQEQDSNESKVFHEELFLSGDWAAALDYTNQDDHQCHHQENVNVAAECV
jgi:hypothetical protein